MIDYFIDIFAGNISFNTKEEFDVIQNKIKHGNWIENQYNEAKVISPNKEFWVKHKNDLLESHIIKPIIGFLNSIEGNGTLYLGINTNDGKGIRNKKFEKIVPVSRDIIKNQHILEKMIFSKSGGNIGVYPSLSEEPNIYITEISFENGNVYVINVQRKYSNSTFYSKITNKIYKRSNDDTYALNLQEQINFIESKKIARITVNSHILNTNDKPILKFSYINKGNMLAKHIHNRMQIFSDPYITFETTIKTATGTINEKPTAESILNKNNKLLNNYIYDFLAGYPPKTLYLYPNVPMVLCDIKASGKGIFSIRFDIYEDKGKSIQVFRYKLEDNNVIQISEDIDVDLQPYM
jgi:hypothetical protein